MFRSRHQKTPYKHIAHRLDKSELACRLHYHHMTVGRKGHRAGESDDEVSEGSRSLSPPTIHLESEQLSQEEVENAPRGQRVHPDSITPKPCTLPSFDTFLRDTFHRRSMSMPGSLVDGDYSMLESDRREETSLADGNGNGSQLARSLSGAWVPEQGSVVDFVEPAFVPRSPGSQLGQQSQHLPSPNRQRLCSPGSLPKAVSELQQRTTSNIHDRILGPQRVQRHENVKSLQQ